MSYRLSRPARRELMSIDRHISPRNPKAANLLLEEFRTMFDTLGDNPFIGRTRDEVLPGYRSLAVGNYIVFYRVVNGRVEIMNIVHGNRDIGQYPFDS